MLTSRTHVSKQRCFTKKAHSPTSPPRPSFHSTDTISFHTHMRIRTTYINLVIALLNASCAAQQALSGRRGG